MIGAIHHQKVSHRVVRYTYMVFPKLLESEVLGNITSNSTNFSLAWRTKIRKQSQKCLKLNSHLLSLRKRLIYLRGLYNVHTVLENKNLNCCCEFVWRPVGNSPKKTKWLFSDLARLLEKNVKMF